MITLEKNGNRLIKTSVEGPWFLEEWRQITSTQISGGCDVLDDRCVQVEIEENIIVFDYDSIQINGDSFTDVESLKNYLTV
jgi:hypothetical protein